MNADFLQGLSQLLTPYRSGQTRIASALGGSTSVLHEPTYELGVALLVLAVLGALHLESQELILLFHGLRVELMVSNLHAHLMRLHRHFLEFSVHLVSLMQGGFVLLADVLQLAD